MKALLGAAIGALAICASPAVLSAQKVVAFYDFESMDLSSTHAAANAASDISLTQPNVYWYEPSIDDTLLCFDVEWLNDGEMTFTVTPAAGETLDFTRFYWKSWKDRQTSPVTVDKATVFVNDVQLAVFDPLMPIGHNVVDLSNVAMLQGVDEPTVFRVLFEGAVGGRNSYEIDSVGVEAKSCIVNDDFGNAMAVYIPGLDSNWRVVDGSSFCERGDGTATWIGALVNVSDPCLRFSFQIDFSGRVDFGDMDFPPAGSPELNDGVTNELVENGGTIDLDTWHYYTDVTGTMNGRLCYEGAVVQLDNTGLSAAQVGLGANLTTLAVGLGAWMNTTVTQQPNDGAYAIGSMLGADGKGVIGDCECIGGVVASWSNYGAGTPGCNGIPTIGLSADPLVDSSPEILVSNPNGVSHAGAIVWSFVPDNVFVPFLGGNLLVGSPIIIAFGFTNPVGGYSLPCEIRNTACLAGTTFYAQAILMDQCVPFSMSDGLKIDIGDL